MKRVRPRPVARLARLVFALTMPTLHAAPPPLLQWPSNQATNVPLTTTLRWSWSDSLLLNGAFEQGLTNGWRLGGPNSNIWSLFPDSDIQSGTNVASATLSGSRSNSGALIQPVTIPPDTIAATLTWYESLNYTPFTGTPLPSLEVSLWSGSQTKLQSLHVSFGIEAEWMRYKWRQRTNDLTAYKNQTLQLVVQASNPQGKDFNPWVDGFSLLIERTTLPKFNVYLGKALPLGAANLVAQLSALEIGVTNLTTNSLYYWQVGSVRDGVTNWSAAFRFTTSQPIPPAITVVSWTADNVTVRFDTQVDLFYTVEQTDNLESASWNEASASTRGSGNPTTVDLPINPSDRRFWRVRVSQ